MKKRRLSFRLESDEAAVIAPVEFWDQLHENCCISAEEFPEQAIGWLEAADHIAEWREKTRDKRA